jgi:hypothetical protein
MSGLPTKSSTENFLDPDNDRFAIWVGRLLLVLALTAIVIRFLTIPWDFGGCFLQVWVSLVGTGGFMMLLTRLNTGQRVLASCLLGPCLAISFFIPIYFGPQAVFPFLFIGAAVAGLFWFKPKSKFITAAIAALIVFPLSVMCVSSIQDMALVTRFRGLKGDDLREIRFVPAEAGKQTVVVRDPSALAQIAATLHSTTPYSPNHESIRNAWEVTMVLTNGSTISCRVGKGNRAHPEMAWIQFDSEVYQNPKLPTVLAETAGMQDFAPRPRP